MTTITDTITAGIASFESRIDGTEGRQRATFARNVECGRRFLAMIADMDTGSLRADPMTIIRITKAAGWSVEDDEAVRRCHQRGLSSIRSGQ